MNTLYCGDNLNIMESLPAKSVDLIATDPPFNTGRDWGAFNDKWESGLKGYLKFMEPRLEQCHRVLKDTGSLYLHCDPTASHYLKVMLDGMFGIDNFRNEIVWKRNSAHNSGSQYGRIHDTLFFYSKSDNWIWNIVYTELSAEYLKKRYRYSDDMGVFGLQTLQGQGSTGGLSSKSWRGINPGKNNRHWSAPRRASIPDKIKLPDTYESLTVHEKLDVLDAKGLVYWPPKGKVPRFKRYLSQVKGRKLQDIFTDICTVQGSSKENLNYSTQKPRALYERIIKASSNEGDIVLDPFCGSGTTLDAAQTLGRNYIGIDQNPEAIEICRKRLG